MTDYKIGYGLPEMWVRDEALFVNRDPRVAVNLSPYPITLSWPHTVPLPPNGRVDVAPVGIRGRKDYGNGEVARVLFLPVGGGGSDRTYTIIIPQASEFPYPQSHVTLLTSRFRSVQVKNDGPFAVDLFAWWIPFFVPVGGVGIPVGRDSNLAALRRQDGPFNNHDHGHVQAGGEPGLFTSVGTTQWLRCETERCGTRFTPALKSLSGGAYGLDAGQVQVSMHGRLTLSRSGGELDLARARVDLLSVLDEAGAAGELVDAAASGPMHLVPSGRRGPTTVFFETRPRFAQPIFRLEVTRRSGRLLDFTLNVARTALSHAPELCSAAQPSVTVLTTRFVIYDGQSWPVEVTARKAWECVGSQPQEPDALLLH